MAPLNVQMTVPFPNDSGPTFTRWLPETDYVTFQHGKVTVSLSFPKSTWRTLFEKVDISKHVNIITRSVVVDVLTEASDALIAELERGESLKHGTQSSEYQEVGGAIYDVVVYSTNRLVAYCRSVKRQYWVKEIERDRKNMGQLFIRSDAIAKLSGGKIVRFDPSNTSSPRRISSE